MSMYYTASQVPEAVQLSIIRAYKAGDSMKNAGYGHNTAPKAVKQILKKHKVEIRKRGYVVNAKGKTVHVTAVNKAHKVGRPAAMRIAVPTPAVTPAVPASAPENEVGDGGLGVLRTLVSNGIVSKKAVLAMAGEFLS